MNDRRQLELYGRTDVGCVRTGNEDGFLLQIAGKPMPSLNAVPKEGVLGPAEVIAAVSDGMGGAAAGEVASRTALVTLSRYLEERNPSLTQGDCSAKVRLVEAAVHLANQAVIEKGREMGIKKTMGATITAALFAGDALYLFQVGDSRAYVMRAGCLAPVTRDQSFVGHLVAMGTITEEQALKHPQRNVILQALGTQDHLKVDVSYLPLCRGDLVLLCSDGLYSEFEPDALNELVNQSAALPLPELVNRLVDTAVESGGKDNITVLGIRAQAGFPPREPGENPRFLPFPFLDLDNPFKKSDNLFR